MKALFALTFLAFFALSGAFGGPPDTGPREGASSAIDVKALGALSADDATTQLRSLTGERAALELRVCSQLVDPNATKEAKLVAIYLAGLYRLPDAVDQLVGMISLEYDGPVTATTSPPFWGRYPAVDALVRIGSPSVRPVLELLSTEDVAKSRDLALTTLCKVLGSPLAASELRIACENEHEGPRLARLRAAAAALKGLVGASTVKGHP